MRLRSYRQQAARCRLLARLWQVVGLLLRRWQNWTANLDTAELVAQPEMRYGIGIMPTNDGGDPNLPSDVVLRAMLEREPGRVHCDGLRAQAMAREILRLRRENEYLRQQAEQLSRDMPSAFGGIYPSGTRFVYAVKDVSIGRCNIGVGQVGAAAGGRRWRHAPPHPRQAAEASGAGTQGIALRGGQGGGEEGRA